MQLRDHATLTLHTPDDVVDESVVDIYPAENSSGPPVVYLHGFGEENELNQEFFGNMAEQGHTVFSPRFVPGHDKLNVLQRVLSEPVLTEKPIVVAHSAGSTAFGGKDLSEDTIRDLRETIDELFLASIPLDKRLTVSRLCYRFALSYLDAIARGEGKEAIQDIPRGIRWMRSGSMLKEVQTIAGNKLHENLPKLLQEFKDRVYVIVDPEADVLCPAQDTLEAVAQYEQDGDTSANVKLLRNAGHTPNIHRPFQLASIISSPSRVRRLAARLRGKFAEKLENMRTRAKGS